MVIVNVFDRTVIAPLKALHVDERLQVHALIDKFLPYLNDFKVTPKHKREILNIDELMMPIQIEEKHRE